MEGRDFEAADNAVAAAPVAIVSQALARRIWGGESPIGKRVHAGETTRPWYTVVGMAGDVHHRGLDNAETMQLYVPTRRWFFQDQQVDVVVRTAGDPARILPALRRAVLEPDPQAVVTRLATMADVRAQSTAQRSLVLTLFAVFATVALLLAAAGLFGALAGVVVERRREIGLRSALGATPRDIVEMVARQGLVLTGGGVVMGLITTLAGAGIIRAMLFGVGPRDFMTIVGVAFVIGFAAVAASVVPAWRALRVDPIATLRAD
jgi:putative ABC transport system permease protein